MKPAKGSKEWFQRMVSKGFGNAMADWMCAGNRLPDGVRAEDVLRTFVYRHADGKPGMSRREWEKLIRLLGKGIVPDALIKDTICESQVVEAVLSLANKRPDLLSREEAARHVSLDGVVKAISDAGRIHSRGHARRKQLLVERATSLPGVQDLLTVKEVLDS